MQFQTQTTQAYQQLKTPALIIGVFEDGSLTEAASVLDLASHNVIAELLKKEFKASLAKYLILRNLEGVAAQRVILMGLGKKDDYNANALLKIHRQLFSILNELSIEQATNTLLEVDCDGLGVHHKARLAARALHNASYFYHTTITQRPAPSVHLQTVTFSIAKNHTTAAQDGLAEGRAIAAGMKLTRHLGNLPANICTPTYLADQAKSLAKEFKSIKVEILERKQIESLKMGAFLAVAAGTEQPPRFIVMKYQGTKKDSQQAPVVLVGKGVTFDSGGISLKPGLGMDEMKWDMCGAATVFGVMRFLAEAQYSQDVIGIVAATENMPSGKATKPGDVITSMSGQTIEVLNTDAEGRLVLCDALTYAERFKPAAVIDMATLTGACVIALGSVNTGLYSNNEALLRSLQNAGQEAQDKAWPMPLDDAYQEQLKSHYADMANIGGREAGSVTAACFLSRFAKNYPWAHLDIAGTAWNKNGEDKGAIGRPVPLLAQYLLNRVQDER
ncbi:leucyl aminopeptidase [Brackiella oedipodis]|uniref:leucyl aminopeptidase n=1 Tax=Brackiella oedipodis TaxID=124225 RepID=UPI00048B6D7D|nr:leucyl aminopeptidase [Brackiella oedipodis]